MDLSFRTKPARQLEQAFIDCFNNSTFFKKIKLYGVLKNLIVYELFYSATGAYSKTFYKTANYNL